jgi:hypothetical protein
VRSSLLRPDRSRGRVRRTALIAAGALAVPLLTVASPLLPAQAQITGSSFEGNDGNLTLAAGSTNKDWVNAPNFAAGIDKPTGKNDDSFSGGIDEDTVNPTLATGAIPNSKDDLIRFYTGFERVSSGARMLYLAWIRSKTSGSADMDFELNQNSATTSDGLPVRTPGDILVTYEFISTKTPDIRIQRWITSGSGCVTASAPPCWANRMTLTSPQAEAAVNDGFATPDPRFLTGGKATSLPSQTFGEAAINLSSLGIFSDTGPCTRFARAFAKTRSSQSFNSSMQDLIAPISIDFSNCATKTFDITATGGVPSGTTLYAVYTKNGSTTAVPLTGTGTTGHLTGSDGSVTPGSTLTNLHLELRDAAGNVVWQGASQSETISQSTTNNGAFSYAVSLSPASAENFVGRPHVLTATATGTGSLNGAAPTTAPLKGVTVGFRLESGTPSGCGSLSPTSATTNTAGQAQTTLTSSTACSTTIRAFVDRATSTSGYDGTDASGTATKTFVAYAVSVSPASATNVMGTNHTFTITLTRNTGSGATGYAGQTVSFALTNVGTTGAHLVSVNGSPASGTSGTCTTTASGTCSVVATATSPGTFTLSATYQTQSDSGQGSFTGSGTKSFVDYRVLVTPASATNEVGVPHTFSVTLQRDNGSGWQGFAGQTVSLSLDPGTSDAHLTSVNGSPASGTSGTCTTRADGTCSVTISGTTAGVATLTATFGTHLDSGDLTRSASGTKQYSDFALTVTPETALNPVGQAHTFTVTLTRNDGSGFSPYAGQPVSLTLDPGASNAQFTSINGAAASGTGPVTCTTSAAGQCVVVANATTPGTATLTATWSEVLSTNSTATRSDSGVKRWLDLTVAKLACTNAVPLGGLVRFDIPWSVRGTALTNARIVDDLPAGLTYVSASPAPSSAPLPGDSGQVVWTLPNPLADGSSGTVSIVASLAQAGSWTNSGHFLADDGVSFPFSSTVTASNAGASATGQAYGLKVDLLGSNLIPPTPSVGPGAGSDSLLSLGIPPLAPTVLSGNVGVLNVSNAPSITATGAEDDASADVANVNLVVAGIPIKAKAVAARSDSIATGSFAGTSTSGSEVVDLQVGAMAPIDVASPTVLPVVHAPGLIDVSVSVLEPTGASGAAAGVPQPAGGKFASGLTVNGLHIRATSGSTVLADVIVSQAKSAAAFPTLTPCAGTGPYLIGNAFVAKEDLTTPVVTVGLPVGLVTLNAAGGSVSRTLNTADLSFLGATSGTGDTSTTGSLATMRVDSDAQVQRLKLALGAAGTVIDAALIHAHASKNSTTPSNAEIAKLIIAGQDVCAALAALPLPVPTGPGGICKPNPNTVLLDLPGLLKIVLNEQMTANNVTTVNAVHVYVLGPGNALGLPVGSDLIISSATAGIGS